jgi:hypothetical protein
MATTRSFDSMLNQYLTYDLLKEELVKRDYVLSKIEKENGWKGGAIQVPFKAAGASSVAFGSLTDSTDVSEDVYVRGQVSTQKELWGTMSFNHRDLMEHDGAVSEKSFLKILPDAVEDFMDRMKETVSINLLNGSHFGKLTADANANDGIIDVDHPERFAIGQKVIVKDSGGSVTGYVKEIDINAKQVLLVTTRSGAVVCDFSATSILVADGGKCYNPGADTLSFSSLREALLPASVGGSSTLYGVSKSAYPYLQSISIDGSSITASNIVDKIFDAYVNIRTFGKGNPNEVIVSYKHLGNIMKALESSKGAYHIDQTSTKVMAYGWTEIAIGGIKGQLKIIGVQEMDDDFIAFMDWRAAKFHTNGFFRKRVAPDGKTYYEVRSTSGYKYLLDMCLFGELVVSKPSYLGAIHSISY